MISDGEMPVLVLGLLFPVSLGCVFYAYRYNMLSDGRVNPGDASFVMLEEPTHQSDDDHRAIRASKDRL